MTILDIENKNTALLIALTDSVKEVATAIANLPVATGSTPPDNSALTAAIQTLSDKVTDVQSQLETSSAPATPVPAPETAS